MNNRVSAAAGTTDGTRRTRLSVIDYLKAVLILLVILNHSNLFAKDNLIFLLFINPAVPAFMVLSGFTFARSAQAGSLAALFHRSLQFRRIVRYTLPAVVYSIAWSIYKFCFASCFPSKILKDLLFVSIGPGSYYFPLMIEFLFVAPLQLYCFYKWDHYGLLLSAAAALLWELFCKGVHLPLPLYRILIIRYVFHISCGMMLWKVLSSGKRLPPVVLILSSAAGFCYLFLPSTGYSYRLFSYSVWGRTSMVTVLWVFPILYALIRRYSDKSLPGKLHMILSYAGKSSYHMMFVQMFAYVVMYDHTDTMVDLSLPGRFLAFVIIAVLSTLLGIIWYKKESSVLLLCDSLSESRRQRTRTHQ